MTSDLSLVVQVAVGGNRRAFDELVHRYQSPVRRFFLHQTLGDSQLSDDLAQDTFLKAYQHIGSFRGMASFQTWLMRIAFRVFYDYIRREKARREGESHPSGLQPVEGLAAGNASHFDTQSALRIDIYAALALLKPEERTCITLQMIDGYDIKGIAAITQLKEGTVKSHISRGKEKMANYLRNNGYGR